MHIVVTGSEGFVGRALVARLLRHGLGGQALTQLTLLDTGFAEPHADIRVLQVPGSIASAALRAEAYAQPVDVVFHLASVPGGAAEQHYEAGRDINLLSTLSLLEDLRGQPRPPRFVFASSVAVYGGDLPATMDEHAPTRPGLSYGTHKLAGELFVADASRRGWVQGFSLRLPGVVARPGSGAGLMSAFMSRVFWALAAGEPLTVPVSADGAAWWISVGACVDNLLVAATADPQRFNASRVYTMPVLHLRVGQVVDALVQLHGADRRALVSYAPDPKVQRLFAAYPPLATPEAEALGLRHDGDIHTLIRRATEAPDTP